MKAFIAMALPIALTWLGIELRKWHLRRQETEEQRERDRRRRLP